MKINLLAKKTAAVGLSLCMLGGLSYNIPEFQNFSIVANAEDCCYSFDSTTGQLTLKGNVVRDEIYYFADKEAVKSITAEKGTVFPGVCNDLFSNYINCETIDLSNGDTSDVGYMPRMFKNCHHLKSVNLSSFDTSKVETMESMFEGCYRLKSLDLSSFDTGKVYKFNSMFSKCYSLESLDLSNFNTQSAGDLYYMFANCRSLKSVDVSSFDTSKVKNMDEMFLECRNLTSVDVSSFDTTNVQFMSNMFDSCIRLTSLDLSSFDLSNVTKRSGLLNYCYSLKEITLSSSFTDFDEKFYLRNADGWANKNDPSTIISGSGEIAVFTNSGVNTYIRKGDLELPSIFTLPMRLPDEPITLPTLPITTNSENDQITTTTSKPAATSAVTTTTTSKPVETSVTTTASLSVIMKLTAPISVYTYAGNVSEETLGTIYYANGKSASSTIDVDVDIVFEKNNVTAEDIVCEPDADGNYAIKAKLTASDDAENGIVTYDIIINKITDSDGNDITSYCPPFKGVPFVYVGEKESIEIMRTATTTSATTTTYSATTTTTSKSKSTTTSVAPTSATTAVSSDTPAVTTSNNSDKCYTFDSETGEMTLRGNVVLDDITSFTDKKNVKAITAEKGTVFPEDCSYLFKEYVACKSIDLSNVDTSKVKIMSGMFKSCNSVRSFELSSFDTSNVTKMDNMFGSLYNIREINLKSFDTSNVTDMESMFFNCVALDSLDLSGFDVSNVTNMKGMFDCSASLRELTLSSSFVKVTKNICLSNTEITAFNTMGNSVPIKTNGWANKNDPSVLIAGSGKYAEFTNTGVNTYIREDILASQTTSETTTSTTTVTTTNTVTSTDAVTTNSDIILERDVIKYFKLYSGQTIEETVGKIRYQNIKNPSSTINIDFDIVIDGNKFSAKNLHCEQDGSDIYLLKADITVPADAERSTAYYDIILKKITDSEGNDITSYYTDRYNSKYGAVIFTDNVQSSSTTSLSATTSVAVTTTTIAEASDYVLGDVDGNNIVDGRDASNVLTYYAMSSTGGTYEEYTDAQKKAADYDKDGIIDGRDATAILTYYAKISTGKE